MPCKGPISGGDKISLLGWDQRYYFEECQVFWNGKKIKEAIARNCIHIDLPPGEGVVPVLVLCNDEQIIDIGFFTYIADADSKLALRLD